MIKSQEFLLTRLSELYNELPYLEIQYEYRSNINTHIIFVLPNHCFEKDADYVRMQITLEDNFEELFPNEEIVFISDNDLFSVERPILSLGVSNIDVQYESLHVYSEMENLELEYADYLNEPIVSYQINTQLTEVFQVPINDKKVNWYSLKPKKPNLANKQGFFLNKN